MGYINSLIKPVDHAKNIIDITAGTSNDTFNEPVLNSAISRYRKRNNMYSDKKNANNGRDKKKTARLNGGAMPTRI